MLSKIIGALMLLFVFVLIFIAIANNSSAKEATLVFIAAIATLALIVFAAWLIAR